MTPTHNSHNNMSHLQPSFLRQSWLTIVFVMNGCLTIAWNAAAEGGPTTIPETIIVGESMMMTYETDQGYQSVPSNSVYLNLMPSPGSYQEGSQFPRSSRVTPIEPVDHKTRSSNPQPNPQYVTLTPQFNISNPIDPSTLFNLHFVKRITRLNDKIFKEVMDDPNDAHGDRSLPWGENYIKGKSGNLVTPTDRVAVQTDDRLEYSIYFLSSGKHALNTVLLCDRMPEQRPWCDRRQSQSPPEHLKSQ